ncbi:MAG: tyrosine-protein phosphatase [Chloroflexi bacterium]|nr:tyrosine-protein phosphatase [Chloroflexota bacterium]
MQRLIIPGSNIRDVGGYATPSGQTRWRALVRANLLIPWSPQEQQTLLDYGVKLIIDLRDDFEIAERPNPFAGSTQLTYLNLPLIGRERHLGSAFVTLRDTLRDNSELNIFMLDECRPNIGAILAAIAAHSTRATLIHCSGGKDRTGIITMLLLALAGVDEATICADYAQTKECLAVPFARYLADTEAAGGDGAQLRRLLDSTPEAMAATLAHVRARYGGVEAYVRACGLDNAQIAALRGLLLQ